MKDNINITLDGEPFDIDEINIYHNFTKRGSLLADITFYKKNKKGNKYSEDTPDGKMPAKDSMICLVEKILADENGFTEINLIGK